MQRLRRHCLPGLLPSGQVFMRGDIMDALTCVELGKEMVKVFNLDLLDYFYKGLKMKSDKIELQKQF